MSDCQGQQNGEVTGHPHPTPTTTAFMAWLETLLGTQTLAEVGRELGVDASCVSRWLHGKRRIPLTALLLAGHLMREPREVAAGLPDGRGRRPGG